MGLFDNIVSKTKETGKSISNKVSNATKSMREKATQKLAYSEEEIAERKSKEGIVYVFDGGNGALIEVYNDRVTLCRNKHIYGSFAGIAGETVGEKTIYIKDLVSVEFKPAQKWCIGYIRFTVIGGGNVRKTTADAADDPNSLPLALVERNDEAEEIKQFVEKSLANIKGDNSLSASQVRLSSADELKKYKELLDSGIISQEEFDAKKKQLLGI